MSDSKKRWYLKGADPVQWGVAVVAPVAAAALTLSYAGMSALPIVVAAVVVGLLYGIAAFYLLSPNAARAVLVLGFLVCVTALISIKSTLVLGLPTWLLSGIAGAIIGAHFRYLTDRKNAGGPARAGSSGLRVLWQVGRKQFEASTETGATLEQKISALDGSKQSVVSALRGTARMDFCGDSHGAMVVYFSPDTRKDDHWSFLTTPGAEPGRTDVVLGDLKGSFSFEECTNLESALAASRHFVVTGAADPKLTWFVSPEVFDRRPLPS
ncbi:hypothetical protein ACIPVK_20155 [Paeniglutamicibacter sp. MACA_103]|uniref:hypothetical protein n=1 Tax=Paeniglutamicibacter sp. MACA_103 TaxID=3377337 RepID=UPI003893C8FC